MAAFPVDTPIRLHPWAHNGLGFLLASGELPAPWSLTKPAAQPETRHRADAARGSQPGSYPDRQKSPGYGAGGGQPTFNRGGGAVRSPEPAAAPAGSPPLRGGVSGRPEDHPAPASRAPGQTFYQNAPPAPPRRPGQPSGQLPPDGEQGGRQNPARRVAVPSASATPDTTTWPRPWQEIFQRMRPGRVLWTYQLLGEDLCGTPDPERRALLNRLLHDMALPPGSSTFWPCQLPASSGEKSTPHIFWEGVRLLKSRVVILMGYHAVLATGLPKETTLWMQVQHEGCFVYVVPDVPLLIKEPHRYSPALSFLRDNLATKIR